MPPGTYVPSAGSTPTCYYPPNNPAALFAHLGADLLIAQDRFVFGNHRQKSQNSLQVLFYCLVDLTGSGSLDILMEGKSLSTVIMTQPMTAYLAN